MTAALGRRERKKLETRQALADAAVRLTLERGLDHVTVEDIADAVDVSARTFFNYFPSKEAAIVGMDPVHIVDLALRLRERPAEESPAVALRAILIDGADDETLNAAMERRALRAELVCRHPVLLPHQLGGYAELEGALADALRERLGVGDDDLFPEVAVAATTAAMRAVLNRCVGDGSRSLRHELIRALDIVASGLESGPRSSTERPTDRSTTSSTGRRQQVDP